MPIFPWLNAAFVHIPKTGGSTVARILKRDHLLDLGQDKASRKFDSGDTIFAAIEALGEDADKYYKFGFVRNPWDRVVSAYHYVVQRRPEIASVNSHASFSDFVSAFRSDPKLYLDIRYFRPQCRYLCDEQGNSPADFIGRFERYDEDLRKVLGHLKLERSLIRQRKRSDRSDYRDYYDNESRAAIGELYARDIEIFGYDFDDGQRRRSSRLFHWLR